MDERCHLQTSCRKGPGAGRDLDLDIKHNPPLPPRLVLEIFPDRWSSLREWGTEGPIPLKKRMCVTKCSFFNYEV